MKKIEKTVGKLTEAQIDVYRKMSHCLNAARFCIEVTAEAHDKKEINLDTSRNFIKEVLHELEDRKHLEYQMWARLREEYKLTDDEFRRAWIDEDTGEFNILSKEYFEKSASGKLDITRFNLMWEGDNNE